MKKYKMKQANALFLFIILLTAYGCSQNNTIHFHDDINKVRSSLQSTSVLFNKVDGQVEGITFNSTYIHFTGNQIPLNSEQPKFPFQNFNNKEFKEFIASLKFLHANNIIGMTGRSRQDFVTFLLKHDIGDEYRDLRYVAIDTGNLNLAHTGFEIIDRKASIVLITSTR